MEMAYRRSRHRRMSKKAGRASRKGGLRRSKKAGLRRTKRAGLSRRVKRGGKHCPWHWCGIQALTQRHTGPPDKQFTSN